MATKDEIRALIEQEKGNLREFTANRDSSADVTEYRWWQQKIDEVIRIITEYSVALTSDDEIGEPKNRKVIGGQPADPAAAKQAPDEGGITGRIKQVAVSGSSNIFGFFGESELTSFRFMERIGRNKDGQGVYADNFRFFGIQNDTAGGFLRFESSDGSESPFGFGRNLSDAERDSIAKDIQKTQDEIARLEDKLGNEVLDGEETERIVKAIEDQNRKLSGLRASQSRDTKFGGFQANYGKYVVLNSAQKAEIAAINKKVAEGKISKSAAKALKNKVKQAAITAGQVRTAWGSPMGIFGISPGKALKAGVSALPPGVDPNDLSRIAIVGGITYYEYKDKARNLDPAAPSSTGPNVEGRAVPVGGGVGNTARWYQQNTGLSDAQIEESFRLANLGPAFRDRSGAGGSFAGAGTININPFIPQAEEAQEQGYVYGGGAYVDDPSDQTRTGLRAQSPLPRGDPRIGLMGTVFFPEAAKGRYFLGSEGTPISYLPIKTDACFAQGTVHPSDGAQRCGPLFFTDGEAGKIPVHGWTENWQEGLFKGEFWHDETHAGAHADIDLATAMEKGLAYNTGAYVPVTRVTSAVPPGTEPPKTRQRIQSEDPDPDDPQPGPGPHHLAGAGRLPQASKWGYLSGQRPMTAIEAPVGTAGAVPGVHLRNTAGFGWESVIAGRPNQINLSNGASFRAFAGPQGGGTAAQMIVMPGGAPGSCSLMGDQINLQGISLNANTQVLRGLLDPNAGALASPISSFASNLGGLPTSNMIGQNIEALPGQSLRLTDPAFFAPQVVNGNADVDAPAFMVSQEGSGRFNAPTLLVDQRHTGATNDHIGTGSGGFAVTAEDGVQARSANIFRQVNQTGNIVSIGQKADSGNRRSAFMPYMAVADTGFQWNYNPDDQTGYSIRDTSNLDGARTETLLNQSGTQVLSSGTLTDTRIAFADSNGLLADDTNIGWDGTHLNLGNGKDLRIDGNTRYQESSIYATGAYTVEGAGQVTIKAADNLLLEGQGDSYSLTTGAALTTTAQTIIQAISENQAAAASAGTNWQNDLVETGDNQTVTDSSAAVQAFRPLNNFKLTLPAEASANHPFVVFNIDWSETYKITVVTDAGPTLCELTGNQGAWIFPMGHQA